MRVLLAMLVGLTQVAGPWLCVCGPARATTAAPVAPVERCPLCDCTPSTPPTDQPPGLPAPCPCGGKVLAPVGPAKQPDALAAFALDPPAVAFAAAGPAAIVVPSAAGVNELPFLPPGTRLFVHHVLRC